MSRDHYQILGVARDASQEGIHEAYLRLTRLLHPDLHPDNKAATKRFCDVQAAYDVLSDRKRREEYELTLESARKEPPKPAKSGDQLQSPLAYVAQVRKHGRSSSGNALSPGQLLKLVIGLWLGYFVLLGVVVVIPPLVYAISTSDRDASDGPLVEGPAEHRAKMFIAVVLLGPMVVFLIVMAFLSLGWLVDQKYRR